MVNNFFGNSKRLSFSAMRRGPGGEKTDLGDELLDGVVRTVTAQAGDMRGGTPRRRARLYNNKACMFVIYFICLN
jgi:hypothetical protein